MCAIGAIHPPPIEVGVFLHFLINKWGENYEKL